MRRTTLLLILIFLTSFKPGYRECQITYIANAGFLIKSGNIKILIDALHIHGSDVYDKPTVGLIDSMITGKWIFNKIDFLAVTHFHPDHFDDSLTYAFLMNHKETQMICPQQVTDILMKNTENFKRISKRIHTISPDPGKTDSRHIAGLDFTASMIKTDDGKIENLLYIFNVNGMKIMHAGDSKPEHALGISDMDLKNEKIDMAIVDATYGNDKFKTIREKISPKEIVFCHFYVRVSDKLKKAMATDTITFKNVHSFFYPLETKTFRFD